MSPLRTHRLAFKSKSLSMLFIHPTPLSRKQTGGLFHFLSIEPCLSNELSARPADVKMNLYTENATSGRALTIIVLVLS